MTWREYINLYCAGSKQIFMHETPKYPLQFGPAAQAINQSKSFAQSAQILNMRIVLHMSYVSDIYCVRDLVSRMPARSFVGSNSPCDILMWSCCWRTYWDFASRDHSRCFSSKHSFTSSSDSHASISWARSCPSDGRSIMLTCLYQLFAAQQPVRSPGDVEYACCENGIVVKKCQCLLCRSSVKNVSAPLAMVLSGANDTRQYAKAILMTILSSVAESRAQLSSMCKVLQVHFDSATQQHGAHCNFIGLSAKWLQLALMSVDKLS